MPARVGVGIIGLGRRWRRYRPALAALRGRLAVRSVYDQRPVRTERAARELGCHAAAGPTDLLDRDDVRAVLLLDAQWFGLWPVEQAARMGKPVFCAVPLSRDDDHADDVMRRVREACLPVMALLGPLLCPAVTRLHDLLATWLGPPRLVSCDGSGRGAGRPDGGALPALMQACGGLIGGEPAGVRAVAAAEARFVSVLLDFPGGRAAQVNVWDALWPACRIRAATDAGDAEAFLPYTLRWRDAEGSHTLRAPSTSMPRLLLERFLDALAAGAPPTPGLDDANRALLWARAARRSLAEGRRVEIPPTSEDVKTS